MFSTANLLLFSASGSRRQRFADAPQVSCGKRPPTGFVHGPFRGSELLQRTGQEKRKVKRRRAVAHKRLCKLDARCPCSNYARPSLDRRTSTKVYIAAVALIN